MDLQFNCLSNNPKKNCFFSAESQPGTSGEAVTPPTFRSSTTPVKRGPGRPRLKPTGPANQGYRGPPRPRKPIGPLVVPLGSSPAPTPPGRSPAMSPAPSPAPPGAPQDRSGIGFYQQMEEDIFIKHEPPLNI